VTRRARGLTFVEVLIGTTVFFMVLALVFTFFLSGTDSSGRSVEASDALRSVLLATEFLRHDAARLVFQRSDDLKILNGGRGIGMLVVEEMGPDLWSSGTVSISYSLAPVAGAREVYQLVRQEKGPPRPISGCLLKDLLIQYVPVGQVSALQAYLEVTMIGLGSTSARATYTGCSLLPLNPVVAPAPYPYPDPPGGS
jgi:hypothetical protein